MNKFPPEDDRRCTGGGAVCWAGAGDVAGEGVAAQPRAAVPAAEAQPGAAQARPQTWGARWCIIIIVSLRYIYSRPELYTVVVPRLVFLEMDRADIVTGG